MWTFSSYTKRWLWITLEVIRSIQTKLNRVEYKKMEWSRTAFLYQRDMQRVVPDFKRIVPSWAQLLYVLSIQRLLGYWIAFFLKRLGRETKDIKKYLKSHLKTSNVDSVVLQSVDGIIIGWDQSFVGRKFSDFHDVSDLLLNLVR